MPQEEVLRAAKQGDPKAISELINRSLQPKGITARVSLSKDCLMVIAESNQSPQQKELGDFIKKGLTNLNAEGLRRVVVQGRIAGNSTPVWREAFELDSDTKITSTTSKTTPSQSTNPKTNPNASNRISSLLRTRNGERALIAAVTFLLTSALWSGVGFINSKKNGGNTASGISTPSPVASDSSTGSQATPSPQASASSSAITEDEKVKKFVTSYLDKIIGGDDGSGYFCDQGSVTTFFAPRSYEILKANMFQNVGSATVRLDSSNKGGVQITSNWKFYIDRKRPQYAALIGEVGEYGICINLVSENQ